MDQDNNMEAPIETPKVSFADGDFQRPAQFSQSEPAGIIRWITNYSGGFIKDEKQANYVIIAFIVVVIGVSVFLFMSGRPQKHKVTPEDIRNMEESQRQINSYNNI